MMMPN